MTRTLLLAAAAVISITGPSLAQDVAAGEKQFAKCRACHYITAPDGAVIQKGGKIGPNLYGVVGRPIASYPDFKYGEGILTAGAAGLVWDEASLVGYVTDPQEWLQANSGDPKAKSKMAYKLTKGQEDVVAYLASVAPAVAADPAAVDPAAAAPAADGAAPPAVTN